MGLHRTSRGKARTVCSSCKQRLKGQRRERAGLNRQRRACVLIAGYCLHCGKARVAYASTYHATCSVVCEKAHRARAVCRCANCSKAFVPKSDRHKTFCSRECSTVDKARCRQHYPKCRVYFPNCCQCGVAFVARCATSRACSKQCAYDYWYTRVELPRIEALRALIHCGECGAEFQQTHRSQMFCCEMCAARHSSRVRKIKARGVTRVGRFSASAIFKRDGWACRLCGVPTPQALRGTIDPCAPELDHRWPIARGGDHTWWNVQCLCRACNGNKAADPIICPALPGEDADHYADYVACCHGSSSALRECAKQ